MSITATALPRVVSKKLFTFLLICACHKNAGRYYQQTFWKTTNHWQGIVIVWQTTTGRQQLVWTPYLDIQTQVMSATNKHP